MMAGPSGSTPNHLLPYPIPGDTADVPRDIQALAEALDTMSGVPVGTILMWPTATPPGPVSDPKDWLLCVGGSVSADIYPALAAVFGVAAGGTIALPDYRDRFPVGAASPGAAGAVGGSTSITLSTAHLPQHDHPAGPNASNNIPNTSGSGGVWVTSASQYGSGAFNNKFLIHAAGTFSITTRTGNTGAATPTAIDKRPQFRSINFIMRAR